MKHIKITSKGWTSYTGLLGTSWFKDGMSVEPLPRMVSDRLAAVVSFVEINEDGTETPGGAAYRMIAESRERAPISRESARQSEAERLEEERLDTLRAEKAPAERIYTGAELEAIADAKGIKGLREISDAWGVKERSIPNLISATLKAQSKFLSERQARRDALSKKIDAAMFEAEIEAKKAAAAKEDARKAEEAKASELVAHPDFARVYTDGERIFPLAIFLEQAWAASGLTLTGFNRLPLRHHFAAIDAAMRRYEAEHDISLKPVEPIASPAKEAVELDPEFDREGLARVRQAIVDQIANKPAGEA